MSKSVVETGKRDLRPALHVQERRPALPGEDCRRQRGGADALDEVAPARVERDGGFPCCLHARGCLQRRGAAGSKRAALSGMVQSAVKPLGMRRKLAELLYTSETASQHAIGRVLPRLTLAGEANTC